MMEDSQNAMQPGMPVGCIAFQHCDARTIGVLGEGIYLGDIPRFCFLGEVAHAVVLGSWEMVTADVAVFLPLAEYRNRLAARQADGWRVVAVDPAAWRNTTASITCQGHG